MTWDAALPQLKTDPRFTNSPLHVNQQLHLFHDHVGQLRAKHLQSLHALFDSYAPSLAALFSTLPLSSLRVSLPVTKLGLDDSALEHEFEVWQRERTTAARKAFDEMLAENAFVEFWGRLGKIGGEGVEGGVKMDDDDLPEDEGEAGGGRVDMKALAKSVDVGEMEKVLKVGCTRTRVPRLVLTTCQERQTIHCFRSCSRAAGTVASGRALKFLCLGETLLIHLFAGLLITVGCSQALRALNPIVPIYLHSVLYAMYHTSSC